MLRCGRWHEFTPVPLLIRRNIPVLQIDWPPWLYVSPGDHIILV